MLTAGVNALFNADTTIITASDTAHCKATQCIQKFFLLVFLFYGFDLEGWVRFSQ